ncbi:MAG: VPLPA-CTERM sorting domain-containing protein [Xanthomonadales bacterium]|nr:VPLPA-CTERM sorting domain-containing protein [Xanthomonadales bacterium]
MSFGSIRRQLLAVAALAMAAGAAHGASTYQLTSMTFNTSSAPGTYTFGTGALGASFCLSCGSSTAVDDGFGNLTVGAVTYNLNNFGGDILHTWSGTTTVGGTTLIKSAGETCVENIPGGASSPHLCNPADRRGWAGNWYEGLMPDGVTAAPVADFSATVSGSNLVLSVTKNRDAVGGSSETAWLRINYNYTLVPVPAAVWLFGGAIGLLGVVRRRSIAAQA